jgi:hypothetical protein
MINSQSTITGGFVISVKSSAVHSIRNQCNTVSKPFTTCHISANSRPETFANMVFQKTNFRKEAALPDVSFQQFLKFSSVVLLLISYIMPSFGASWSPVANYVASDVFTNSYIVVATHPHDQDSFTQGLEKVRFFWNLKRSMSANRPII